MNAFAGLILLVGCLSSAPFRAQSAEKFDTLSDLVWHGDIPVYDDPEVIQKFKEVSTSGRLDERSKELAELIGALEPDDRICDPNSLATFLQVLLKVKPIDSRWEDLRRNRKLVVQWILSYHYLVNYNCRPKQRVNLKQLQEKFDIFSVFDTHIVGSTSYRGWTAVEFHRAVGQFRSTRPYYRAEDLFQAAYYKHHGIRLDEQAWRNRTYDDMNEEKATQLLDENLLGPCKIFVDETGSTLGRFAFIAAYLSVENEQRPDCHTFEYGCAGLRWAARYLTCSWLLRLDKKTIATTIKDRTIAYGRMWY